MPTRPKKHYLAGNSPKERKRMLDKARPSAYKRGYDRKWHKIRKFVLQEEPMCRFCSGRSLIVAAEHVDHIDGNSRNNVRSNLRPLCASCHNARTARDQAFNSG